jgi:hypothetical protein
MTPQAERGNWRWHVGALLFYAFISLAFIDHGVSLTENIAGQGGDPFSFVWFLGWWPWAIAHHLNPYQSTLAWQPDGINLLWLSSVPLFALIGLPATLLSGPVLTYNLLILTAPVLSAWSAYWLCLRLTCTPLAAIVGGYLFGYSSYETAENFATPNLSFTFLIPCLVLLVLCRGNNEITRLRTVLLFSLMTAMQVLISIEILATSVLFAAIAWLFAYRIMAAYRSALLSLFTDALWAAPVILLVLSPYLLVMFRYKSNVGVPIPWAYYYSADFFNLFIPSPLTLLGGNVATHSGVHVPGNIQEQCGYLGLPLIIILAAFTWQSRRTEAGALLLVLLLVFITASFGPQLWFAGAFTSMKLPWIVFLHLPLIHSALPSRFALYAALVTAIIASWWISNGSETTRNARYALSGLACVFLLPAPHQWMRVPEAHFFAPGRLQAALGPDARLQVLPFGGPSLYWQVENHFGYAQTGTYLGFPWRQMDRYPAVGELFGHFQGPNFLDNITQFCQATNTQYIIAGPGTAAALLAALSQLQWSSRRADDVVIYTVPVPDHG